MMIYRTTFTGIIFITLITNLIFVNGQQFQNDKCDESVVNMHMLECYKENIDETIDVTSSENAYFMDGSILCQAYNLSASYRKCLYSIFADDKVCSFKRYPYSYESFKIYWKLILTSCVVEKNGNCHASHLRQHVIKKCHYSFDDQFPTKCEQFLRSLKCLEKHESELVPLINGRRCSRNKAYYYYYEDLAARIPLAIKICEEDFSS